MTDTLSDPTRMVNVGIVGTSWWADAMYLPALSTHPHTRLVAICGRNRETAQRMADRWHIPQVYTDWEAMIERGGLEAIVISTPNDTHYPIAMRAIEAGLHVLCEKPLALNYRQARAMADAAKARGIKTCVPFTYAHMPNNRFLKEQILGGYIGRPYHLNMRYYAEYARKSEYLWRFDMEVAGGGVIGDLGSHYFYLAEWFYGPIKAVSAHLGYHVNRPATRPDGTPYTPADDSALITVQFHSGAHGLIHVTAVAYEGSPFGQTHHMEFHGSAGTLYSIFDWDKVQLIKGARDGEGMPRELKIPDYFWDGARRDTAQNTYHDVFRKQDRMARGFISAIVRDQPTAPDFEDGARIQRLISAAQRSHAEKRIVEVSEIVE